MMPHSIYHTNPPKAAITDSSGSVIKAARVTGVTDAGGLLTVAFPTPFPSSVISVDAWMESADGDYVKLNAQPTVAGFVVRALNGAHTHTPTTAAVYSGGGVVSQTAFGTTAVVTGYASPTTAAVYSGGGTVATSSYYSGDSSANKPVAHSLGVETKAVLIASDSNLTFHTVQTVSLIFDLINNAGYSVTAGDATNFYVGNAANYTQSANLTDTTYYWMAIGGSAFTTTAVLTGLGAPSTAAAYTSGGVVSQTGFTTTLAVTAVGVGNEDVLALTPIIVHYIAIGS